MSKPENIKIAQTKITSKDELKDVISAIKKSAKINGRASKIMLRTPDGKIQCIEVDCNGKIKK